MKTVLLDSLGKIFPDEVVGNAPENATMLRNERLSFQIAFRLEPGEEAFLNALSVSVESDIPVTEYRIGFVPVLKSCPKKHDSGFDRTTPGLYPDPLYRRKSVHAVKDNGSFAPMWLEEDENELLAAVEDSWQGLWFTLNENEDTIPAGEHRVTVRFSDMVENKVIAERQVSVTVIDALLPRQSVICTNWFHLDCLADHYGVEMFSDRNFEIIGSFMREAAANGQNMIMLPSFTPPLDTTVGSERRTAQLVGVTVTDGGYEFDFTLFERYIKLALECGIEYFEHNHMFTQWGASHAPKIIATVDGREERIFGWETDAGDKKYEDFLRQYFAAMLPCAERLGVREKIFFHTSDEPDVRQIGDYSRASALMRELTDGGTLFDALSHYEFAQQGTTDIPVVTVESTGLEKFSSDGKPFWIYNTGAEIIADYPSRLITNKSVRNRMLGVMMYSIGASGFLNWGYNYYYDVLSHGRHDPSSYTGTFVQRPGASFIVYPSADGRAIPSLRMKVFHEAMSDHRALCLLEQLTSRDSVMKLIEAHFGRLGISYPMTDVELLAFRRDVNAAINAARGKRVAF